MAGKRYHINNSGDVRVCNATVKPCRYAQTPHFTNRAEATGHAEAIYAQEHGALPAQSVKANIKLTKIERELREKNLQLAKQLIAMRAESADGIVFEDANPERAKRRLEEAVEYAKSRENHNLVHKLVKAKVLPSGAFKTKDGERTSTDKFLKHYLADKHIETTRKAMERKLVKLTEGLDDLEGKYKIDKIAGLGSASVTFSNGFNEYELKNLPDATQKAIMETVMAPSAEKAREVLPKELFEKVTTETQVLDVVLGKKPDIGLDNHSSTISDELKGKDTKEKVENALRESLQFYSGFKNTYGNIRDLRKEINTEKEAIKTVAAGKDEYTFAPARSQTNGALVSRRRNLNKAALEEFLTPEQIEAIHAPREVVSMEKAQRILTKEQFAKVYEGRKASLLFTEDNSKK